MVKMPMRSTEKESGLELELDECGLCSYQREGCQCLYTSHSERNWPVYRREKDPGSSGKEHGLTSI